MFGKLDYNVFPKLGKIYTHSRKETKFIYKEVFEEKAYLQHGIELKPADIVFDVGANVGMFTLFANKECENNVSVFAFEPILDTYNLLKKNANLHGLARRNNIELFNLGLTHIGGPKEAIFSYYKNMSGNSTMKPDEKQQAFRGVSPNDIIKVIKLANPFIYILLQPLLPIWPFLVRKIVSKNLKSQKIICNLTTLSDICHQYSVPHIDLLKVDVEGAELDVLRGIEDQYWPKVKQVVMEVHDTDNRLSEIKKLLLGKSFKKVVIIQPDLYKLLKVSAYMVFAKR